MNFEYNKITQAQNRPMTTKESFGLLLFVFKFFFSKFGIFLFFLSLNIFPSFLNRRSQNLVSSKPVLSQTSSKTSFPLIEANHQKNQKNQSGILLPTHSSLPKIREDHSSAKGFTEQGKVDFETNSAYQETRKYSLFDNEIKFSKDFQKLKKYCIIATIVSLFLNPQQTKYFGGLAVVLKQAGFFSKYSKSEKTVYILSWIFILMFFSNSYYLALEFTRKL
jgi:hypothetical protein